MEISEEGIPDRVKVENEAFDRSFALQRLTPAKVFSSRLGLTYLGGSVSETVSALGLAPNGDAYLTGLTLSGDFPIVNGIDGSGGIGIGMMPVSQDSGDTWAVTPGSPPLYSIHGLAKSKAAWIAAGDSGGYSVYRSIDEGGTWKRADMSATYFTAVFGSPADPLRFYLEDTFLGSYYTTTDGGQSWTAMKSISSIAVGRFVPHPLEAKGLFVLGDSVQYSPDAGESWRRIRQGDGNFVFAIAVDTVDPKALSICASNGLFRTADGGATWIATDQRSCRSLAALNTTPQILLAVSAAGDTLISPDGGINWNLVAADSFGGSAPVQVLAGLDGQTLYARGGFTLYRSRDAGSTWTTREMPAGFGYPSSRLELEPQSSTSLYGSSFAATSGRFLAVISADTQTLRMSALVGGAASGGFLEQTGSKLVGSSSGEIVIAPVQLSASDGSVNVGGIVVSKIVFDH